MRGTGWRNLVLSRLLEVRGRSGWPYGAGKEAATEPTVLASLAILAAQSRERPVPIEVAQAASWLAARQQRDGSIGLTESLGSPGWPTPLVILLWENLGGFDEPRRRALQWLLCEEGMTARPQPDGVIGHDPTLCGWPWVAGTHSWLEPTALGVLALRKAGLERHTRVVQAIALIHDRALLGGGWNYGNRAVFGRQLRPQPAPTGLAMLALAGRPNSGPSVARAVGYLSAALPGVETGWSLGWGVLGLSAWHGSPAGAEWWLRKAATRRLSEGASVPGLAMLLLAGAERSLDLLLSMQRERAPAASREVSNGHQTC